jgi:xanthosine utilization system XapX-like protein
LLGILFGGQIIPVSKQMWAGLALSAAWQESKCTSHVFGVLPGRHADEAKIISATETSEKCS